MVPELHGYHYSVYLRMVRFALAAKGVPHVHVAVNPFERPIPPAYLALHPFGRVPSLVHDGFVLYETAAITRYVDEAFAGPALQPQTARLRARMVQIQSVVDSYAYWPMVRQVFAHAVFRPAAGAKADAAEVAAGLEAAPAVLRALGSLAEGAPFLLGGTLSLADIHLAPIVAGFAAVPAGRALLDEVPALAEWWSHMAGHALFAATDPGLPTAAAATPPA